MSLRRDSPGSSITGRRGHSRWSGLSSYQPERDDHQYVDDDSSDTDLGSAASHRTLNRNNDYSDPTGSQGRGHRNSVPIPTYAREGRNEQHETNAPHRRAQPPRQWEQEPRGRTGQVPQSSSAPTVQADNTNERRRLPPERRQRPDDSAIRDGSGPPPDRPGPARNVLELDRAGRGAAAHARARGGSGEPSSFSRGSESPELIPRGPPGIMRPPLLRPGDDGAIQRTTGSMYGGLARRSRVAAEGLVEVTVPDGRGGTISVSGPAWGGPYVEINNYIYNIRRR